MSDPAKSKAVQPAIHIAAPLWRRLWRKMAAKSQEPFAPHAMDWGCANRLCVYRVIWRRRGADDRFTQEVPANSKKEAIRRSQAIVRAALGDNAELWTIQDVSSPRMIDSAGDTY